MARRQPAELTRRALVAAGLAFPFAAQAASSQPFVVSGRPEQGGFVIGRTLPRAVVSVNGETLATASERGFFLVGFDRDEKPDVEIAVRRYADWEPRRFSVRPGHFDVQRIDGLPPSQVEPTDPALLDRISREAKLKAEAFASVAAGDDFRGGFDWPVAATRVSSRFGGQRILNGQPNRPHYGVDLAAPQGAQIRSPAGGLVVLAEPDLHFEGGLTLIDHGQGLIGMFLHQSRLMVRTGERVSKGQPIGEVGMTGRATGPHLCWRLRWRARNLDPSLLVAASPPSGARDALV